MSVYLLLKWKPLIDADVVILSVKYYWLKASVHQAALTVVAEKNLKLFNSGSNQIVFLLRSVWEITRFQSLVNAVDLWKVRYWHQMYKRWTSWAKYCSDVGFTTWWSRSRKLILEIFANKKRDLQYLSSYVLSIYWIIKLIIESWWSIIIRIEEEDITALINKFQVNVKAPYLSDVFA